MSVREPVAAQIREPVLRGRHSIAAVWFPTTWYDEATRAARLVAHWRHGATAFRFPQGDLLHYAAPIEIDCDESSGWPLRQEGHVLSSAPLSDAERRISADGDVWIVLGAEIVALNTRDATTLDPSAWLAVDRLTLLDTYDCRVPLPPPEVLDLESRPLRDVLGDAVPPASPEQSKFLEAMRRARREQSSGQSAQRPTSPRGLGPAFLPVLLFVIGIVAIVAILAIGGADSFRAWWLFIGIVLLRLLIGGLGPAIVETVRELAAPSQQQIPQRSKPASPQRWRQWLARIGMTSRLSRLIGRAQARYLRRMLGMFDDGNLSEALRHAIPLDGQGTDLGQSFGTPGRRNDLSLTRSTGATSLVDFGPELHQHLRALYRNAFEKLDRAGRIDEAVFVLAELLNAKREALDYLEKHERFTQAAELALGWDMPPDVIVRLHCLAGDWRRALAVARRDNAFATAIAQMQQRWPDAARRLREEWGHALLEQGDWTGAIDAVWPVESLRKQATQWLLTAEAAGGYLAARALVQRAVLLPDTLERYADRLLALQRDREQWRERAALAEALIVMGRKPQTARLAALIVPALLADHARGQRRFDQRTLQHLTQATGDVMLQADLPSRDWPTALAEPIGKRNDVLNLVAPPAGAHAILDAVPLGDQCYLLALGEAGACVVDSTGRMRARFAVPAQRLVLAHSTNVALLLSRREALWRVSRLDLAQKTVVDLGMLDFDHWGTQFDGLHWTVARGNKVQVLDVQNSLRQVVWQVTDLPGHVVAMSTASGLEQYLLSSGDATKIPLWKYRLPERRLISRDDVSCAEDQVLLLNPADGVVPVAVESALAAGVNGEWLVVCSRDESAQMVRWMLTATGVERVRLSWPNDADLQFRGHGTEWLVFDGRGRVFALDMMTSRHHTVTVR